MRLKGLELVVRIVGADCALFAIKIDFLGGCGRRRPTWQGSACRAFQSEKAGAIARIFLLIDRQEHGAEQV
jgi:hypothetical protein